MGLVSLKVKTPDGYDSPVMSEYGWGTSIDLTEDQVAALGLNGVPEVGTVFEVAAIAVVKHTNVSDDGDGKERCLCLQFTDMQVTPQRNAATVLYGKGNAEAE
ncbi:capsid staple protein [Pandoraea sputorum]|uniref:capsid staple protein n=1 Tax=Pandoraea sputorum TaxID=93222 RepID=UPI00123F1D72|nr:hypothetical protein [Pandoraea sputorum]VVE77395.1 hypothetical protein PSP31120_01270 [Pandoraea sputorum]